MQNIFIATHGYIIHTRSSIYITGTTTPTLTTTPGTTATPPTTTMTTTTPPPATTAPATTMLPATTTAPTTTTASMDDPTFWLICIQFIVGQILLVLHA